MLFNILFFVVNLRIAKIYSHKGGKELLQREFKTELKEIINVINSIDASKHKIKISKEKTMKGRPLYSPVSLNKEFKKALYQKGWKRKRIKCGDLFKDLTRTYINDKNSVNAFREMDFVKNGLGVEIQFGKYAFMTYDICAKMVIFKNKGIIKAGLEIVPTKTLADEMSTGVSYFEQLVWDLKERTEADIDIPVLVIAVEDDKNFNYQKKLFNGFPKEG